MHDKTLNNFIESNSENIIHNINSIKKYIKLFNIKDIKLLINDINLKIDKYQNSKNTYSSLKSLYIDCNKYLLKQHEHSKERPTNKLKYLLDNIKKQNPEYYNNYEIFNSLENMYAITWNK